MTDSLHGQHIWAVRAGYGLFVVRAATEEDARRIAFEHPDGAEQFGCVVEDIHEVTKLDSDGPDDLLDYHYG